MISPRVLKGFRDALPGEEAKRQALIARLRKLFSDFGYPPIDTPTLEYAEVLLGKGGGETEKQIFRFQDGGGRDVALRFDLTVPFARYMGAHVEELGLPFKRYHIAKAWRGEKPQRGRFREFYQCDCDIVGVDSLSADLEILTLAYTGLSSLDIGAVEIHYSHRGLLNKFIELLELNAETAEELMRRIDKLFKIGAEETQAIVAELIGEDKATRVMNFITRKDSSEATLAALEEATGGPSEASERLRGLMVGLKTLGISESFILDPAITRGLDYYTGMVFESFVCDMSEVGSVCSGGRYNNLASLYTKRDIPGVGCSIGLDRVLSIQELLAEGKDQQQSEGILVLMEPKAADETVLLTHRLAQLIREASGISVAIYHGNKKFGQQFAYAEEQNFAYTAIFERDKWNDLDNDCLDLPFTLRRLSTRDNFELDASPAGIEKLRAIIKG